MNNKVIYFHIAKENFSLDGISFKKDQIVYIGSGSKNRATNNSSRSLSHLSVWNKVRVEIAYQGLSENEAKELEQKLIQENGIENLLNISHTIGKVKPILWEEMNKYFYIDGDILRWKTDRMGGRKYANAKTKAGDEAGWLTKRGYRSLELHGIAYQVHRIIYSLYNKVDLLCNNPIDHIDKNKSNNHPLNLRLVTHSGNNLNKRKKPNSSGYDHILFDELSKRWIVNIKQANFYIKKSFSYRKKYKFLSEPLAKEVALKEAIEFRDSVLKSNEYLSEISKTVIE